MKEKTWWWLSTVVSVLLISVLLILLVGMNRYQLKAERLVNVEAVEKYLANRWESAKHRQETTSQSLTKIPTGIFIQSLKFASSTEVNISGYLWQRYIDGVNAFLKPNPGEVGFILPEQVETGNDIEPRETYRIKQGAEEVIGWYFEATLRQPFNYFYYPFDHKTVWVHLWPKDFSANVVLVPDYKAYKSTGEEDVFGIAKDIVLGTWERDDTYFDFKPACYGTNFGIDGYVGQSGFPNLYYNFVIKRKWGNAFIVHLLPLFLVAALLFAALLTVTRKPELASIHGFTTSGVLGTCSVLFFVVLLAHIHLREQFPGSGIVYMALFYYLMYMALVAVAASTYLFTMKAFPSFTVPYYKDHLIPKVLFWPILLLSMTAFTSYALWSGRPSREGALADCSTRVTGEVGHDQKILRY